MARTTHTVCVGVVSWEPSVVKYRTSPVRRAMACRARFGKTGGRVIRVGGAVVLCGVTGIAICWGARKLSTDVALRALNSGVLAGQRETRRRMVEGGAGPVRGAVAH